jgi:hypothetical protein
MAAVVTDLVSLKAWMDAGSGKTLSSDLDAALTEAIEATENAFEQVMRRPLLEEARVEIIKRTRRFQKRITLASAPVASITSVEYDSSGVFTSPTTVPATDYLAINDEGVLRMREGDSWTEGIGVYRVTYTGGMGADVAAFGAAFPDIRHAAHLQIAYEWQRKRTPGSTTSSGRGGTKTFEGQLSLLKVVKEIIGKYKRLRI